MLRHLTVQQRAKRGLKRLLLCWGLMLAFVFPPAAALGAGTDFLGAGAVARSAGTVFGCSSR